MNKKLEETIKRLKNIVDECKIEIKEIGYEYDLYDGDEPIPYKEIETVLNYIDNSISKEVIEEKIEDYRERMRYYEDEYIIVDDEYYRYEAKVEVLQELLEGK